MGDWDHVLVYNTVWTRKASDIRADYNERELDDEWGRAPRKLDTDIPAMVLTRVPGPVGK